MSSRKKSGRNIFLLGITSFFNDASSEMIMPVLPMFIASLGGSSIVIGLIGGMRECVANVITVFSGYWSDRIGRRRIFVFFGYFVPTIFKFLLAFSKTWGDVFLFSSAERTGKGLRTASRDAIIAESSPYKKGLSFGIHRALDTGGGVAGTLLAFILVWYFYFDFKSLLIVSASISVISLIPLLGVKRTPHLSTEKTLRATLTRLPLKLLFFLIIASTFALANFSYMFFLLKAKASFSGPLSIAMPILFYLLFNIFYAAGAIPLGMLTDYIGRRKVITSGYFLFSLTCFGFLFAETLSFFTLLFSLYGIAYAMVQGNQRAFVADVATEREKATSLGAFHTSIGLLSLLGNIIAGLLWNYIGSYAVFLYGSTVSLLAVVLFLCKKSP